MSNHPEFSGVLLSYATVVTVMFLYSVQQFLQNTYDLVTASPRLEKAR